MLKRGKDYMAEMDLDFAVKKSNSIIIGKDKDDKSRFYDQLKVFKKDLSFIETFDGCDLSDRIGVEIFMYNPNEKLESSILVTDVVGRTLSASSVREATNIAKIIKIGTKVNTDYKIGDLIFLPINLCVGKAPNPRWYEAHQYDDSNLKPVLDDSIPKEASSFVAHLINYAWVPPHMYKIFSEDIRTFAVHEDLFMGKFNFGED